MGDALWGILMLDFRCILQMSMSELPLGEKKNEGANKQ